MKRMMLFMTLVFTFTSFTFSQIVIEQSDMPVSGDTLRVSVTNVVPMGFEQTAMDTIWDFTLLQPLSQRVDTFVNVTQTPLLYQFIFTPGIVANLASPRNGSFFPGVAVTDGYTFYHNTATAFSDVGSAFTIEGLPFPARYDVPEKIFAFPMNPGSTWQSISTFALNIPELVYFSTQRNRDNVVDGWGELKTPFGTFQTLRVKSLILEHDSVYIDSLQIGFPFNRNITEYKWLAKGKGIPVLTVTQEGSMVTATYRDIPRMSVTSLSVSLGPDTAVLIGSTITLHATIKGGTPPYQVVWNTLDSGLNLTITVQDTRTYTVIVVDALQNITSAQRVVAVKFPPGMGENEATKPTLFPNPASSLLYVQIPLAAHQRTITLLNAEGRAVKTVAVPESSKEITIDLNQLPSGFYTVQTDNGITKHHEKLIIRK